MAQAQQMKTTSTGATKKKNSQKYLKEKLS